MVGTRAIAHDIEVKNADGVTIYYTWANNNTELSVSYRGNYASDYYNEYSGNVVIPESVTYNGKTYPVTSIGSQAFALCSDLTSVTIGNSVTSIGSQAFEGCSGLTSVTIPNSVTSIGNYAFSGCSGLTSITIPNSVTTIGPSAFYKCSGLTSVTIGNSVTTIGDRAFIGCKLTTLTIPNSVTSIGESAFSDCELTTLTIPNSVTSIGGNAFSGSRLKSVTIGSGVISIGSNAFSSIKTIWLTNTPPSGYSTARGTINYVANDLYTSLRNKTVYPFLSSIFEVDGVKYVPVSPAERTCDAIDCLYDEKAENINIGASVSHKGVEMTIQRVRSYAFYQNPHIKNVSINWSGDIEDYVFSGCTSLGRIAIPNSITDIGKHAFSGCSSLKEMQIGSNVKTIGQYAFGGCTELPKIQIPRNVTAIDNNIFDGCRSLKIVIMDDGQEEELKLGSNGSSPLFSDCPLDSVYIGRNISYSTESSYGYSPFYRNTSLRSVHITDKETEISPNEFYGCTNLKNVRIGDGVTTIGDWAFSGCSSIDFFSFGSSVKTIGKEAFSDCTAMTKLISRATTPPSCGSQALDDINKWNCTLSVPKGYASSYQQAAQWKEFFFINDDDSNPVIPDNKKCAKPKIYYSNGKLSFESDTEGVIFQSNITDSDIRQYSSNEVQLSVTYNISVYATKSGYENSETATATLCWIDVEPRTEGIDGTTSTKEIKANAVLIQSNNGMITVSGVDDNSNIVVYSAAGQMIASAKCRGNQASVATNLRNGEVAIVRIGDKSVKIVMR